MFDRADLAGVDQLLREREAWRGRPAEADEEHATDALRRVAHAARGASFERERLFHQHMRAGLKRRDHLFFVRHRRAGDDDDVGLVGQHVAPVGEGERHREGGGELLRRLRIRARQRHELDIGMGGERRQMARLRPGAGADDAGADGLGHFTAPAVSAPTTWRWKMTTSTTGGIIDMTVAAASAFQLNCCTDWKPASSGGTVSWLVSTSE